MAFAFDPLHPVFKGLDSSQLKRLSSLSREVSLEKGEYLMREGEIGEEMYFIVEGSLEVIKQDPIDGRDHLIETLHEDQVVGELAFLDHGLRSASVRAITSVKLRTLRFVDLESLAQEEPAFQSIYQHLSRNISHALRKTTGIAAEALRKTIEENQTRVYMGQFLVYIIVILSLIIYSMRPLNYAINHATDSTNVTIPVIVCLTVFVFLMIRSSHLPLDVFGITLKNWKTSLFEGIGFSIPLLIAITLLKFLFIQFIPYYQGRALFEPFALINDPASQTLPFWILVNALYWLFIPAQELMARGALQGLLEKFLLGKHRVLVAIIVSNLIFSTAHVYMSEWIALLAFTGGLFLGWLYARTHNLLGVIVSHGIIGTYTLAIVGP